MSIKTFTKKSAIISAAVSCIAALGFAGSSVMAQDTQDKLNSANSAIEELRKEQGNISTEITDLNQKAEAAGERINELNNDIINKQDDIAAVNDEIGVIEDDMRGRYEDMKLRIRYIYESGDMGLVEAVLSSDEFSDLLNRTEYIQKIYDYDRNELEIMAGLYNERENKRQELETEVASLEGLKSEADAQARSLEALLIDKRDELRLSADKISQLEELAKKYEKQLEEERLAREEEERRKREEDEKRKKAEEERLAREAAEKQAAARSQESETAAARPTTAAPAPSPAPSNNSPAPAQNKPSASSNSGGNSSNSGNAPSNTGYSQNDLALLSAIIEVEAGDQIYEGRLAVGSVVMNRVESSQFPNTISGVIYQSGQFSPVASGRFAACLARGAAPTNVQAAKDVLGGVRNVPYLFFRMHYGKTTANYSSYTIIQDHILYNY